MSKHFLNTDFFAESRMDAQNKLNVHAQEFQMARGDHLQNSRSSMAIFQGHHHGGGGMLQHSKSHGSMHHQLQMVAARQMQLANMNNANKHLANVMANRASISGSGQVHGHQPHQSSPVHSHFKIVDSQI